VVGIDPITTRQYPGWSANGLPAFRKAIRAIGLQTVRDRVLAFDVNRPTRLIDVIGAAGRARGGREAAVAHHLREIL
jgi:hypothetical protein